MLKQPMAETDKAVMSAALAKIPMSDLKVGVAAIPFFGPVIVTRMAAITQWGRRAGVVDRSPTARRLRLPTQQAGANAVAGISPCFDADRGCNNGFKIAAQIMRPPRLPDREEMAASLQRRRDQLVSPALRPRPGITPGRSGRGRRRVAICATHLIEQMRDDLDAVVAEHHLYNCHLPASVEAPPPSANENWRRGYSSFACEASGWRRLAERPGLRLPQPQLSWAFR